MRRLSQPAPGGQEGRCRVRSPRQEDLSSRHRKGSAKRARTECIYLGPGLDHDRDHDLDLDLDFDLDFDRDSDLDRNRARDLDLTFELDLEIDLKLDIKFGREPDLDLDLRFAFDLKLDPDVDIARNSEFDDDVKDWLLAHAERDSKGILIATSPAAKALLEAARKANKENPNTGVRCKTLGTPEYWKRGFGNGCW